MSYKPQKIVGTGYLSRWLIPLLSRKTGVPASLPEYCESANAVGVAVSRVSMTLWGHFDTGRRRAVINGELVPLPAWNDDDDLIAACRETLREMALGAGADPKDLKEISLVYFNSMMSSGGLPERENRGYRHAGRTGNNCWGIMTTESCITRISIPRTASISSRTKGAAHYTLDQLDEEGIWDDPRIIRINPAPANEDDISAVHRKSISHFCAP